MPGWFQEEQKKPIAKEKELEPITDYNELVARFNEIVTTIQTITNQSYGAIMPVVMDLFGSQGRNNPQDFGNVGKLRMQLQDTRLLRTDTGRLMSITIRQIEDLNAWQTRYAQQMEESIDPLKFITENAFKIIESLYEQIEIMDVKVKQMEEYIRMRSGQPIQQMPPSKRQTQSMPPIQYRMPPPMPNYAPQDMPQNYMPQPQMHHPELTQPYVQTQPQIPQIQQSLVPSLNQMVPQYQPPPPPPPPQPLMEEEIDILRKKFEDKYELYLKVKREGGKDYLAKGNIFVLGSKNDVKKALLRKWLVEEETKRYLIQKEGKAELPFKKNLNDQQTNIPISRNPASKDAILNAENPEEGDENASGDMQP